MLLTATKPLILSNSRIQWMIQYMKYTSTRNTNPPRKRKIACARRSIISTHQPPPFTIHPSIHIHPAPQSDKSHTLPDRVIKPELEIRIIPLLQLAQPGQPPGLIPVHGLQRLIPVRVVDVGGQRAAVRAGLHQRSGFGAPFFGFALEVGAGGPSGEEAAVRV